MIRKITPIPVEYTQVKLPKWLGCEWKLIAYRKVRCNDLYFIRNTYGLSLEDVAKRVTLNEQYSLLENENMSWCERWIVAKV